MIQARQTNPEHKHAYKVLKKKVMREICDELDVEDVFKCGRVWHAGISGVVRVPALASCRCLLRAHVNSAHL